MQYDVERLLDALRRVESRGNRFAVSPAGAKGPYQFMPATAQEYGLKGNDVFDETKSRNAARKKLSGLINRYGVEHGIAAYNLGEGNLEKLKGNYKKVAETAQYVPKVLGAYNSLRDAGFRSYNEPKELPMLPPLEPQPEVKQAVDMPEPVIKQTQGGKLLDFSRLKSQQQQQALLAKLNGNVDWGDPNAMVSGRVVQTSPITALANALRTGMGAYHATKADKIGQDLDMQKAQALEQLLQSGQQPDINALVQAGAIGPEQLAEALASKATKGAEYQFLPGTEGWLKGNKATGDIETTGFKSPIYDNAAIAQREGIKQGLKGSEYTDKQGNILYGPAAQRNNYYGQYLNSTGMMPVPGGTEPVIGQSKADEAAAVAAAKAPIEVQQSGQIAQDKALIENQAKIDQQRNEARVKAEIDLPKIKGSAEYTKGLIDEIATHPGLSSMVGTPNPLVGGFGSLGALPGTDAAGFKAKYDQLQGKQFLEAFESLKGGGQITQIEGEKATNAIAAMSTAQKEEDFKKELNKLKEVIDNGYKRAMQKAGMGATESFETKPSAYNPDAMRQKYGIK